MPALVVLNRSEPRCRTARLQDGWDLVSRSADKADPDMITGTGWAANDPLQTVAASHTLGVNAREYFQRGLTDAATINREAFAKHGLATICSSDAARSADTAGFGGLLAGV
jgi:hypothetical protein